MKSMFKSKKSTDAVETPPSAKASVGSSAWRRRVGESARNKLGLSRHETDDVTGDMREGVSSYRAAAAKLKEAVKALESAEASERKADARRKEALRALGDDDALIEACLAQDERTDRFDRTEGWALEPLRAVRKYEALVDSTIASRESLLQDYFARKRKLDSGKKEDERLFKFEQACRAVKAATSRLEPLLEAFVQAAETALSDALKCAAAARIVQLEDAASRLRPWAASTISGESESAARDLLRDVAAARRDGSVVRQAAPASPDLQRLIDVASQQAEVPEAATPTTAPEVVPDVSDEEARTLRALLRRLSGEDALSRKGLFRIPGDATNCAAARERLAAGDDVAGSLDVDDAATLAKGWFRDRPGLLPRSVNEALRAAAEACADDEQFAGQARELLDGVPVVRDLLSLLHAVSMREADNAMTPENLAICWAPNVFVLDPNSAASVADLQPAIRLTARLVAVGDRLA
mmetsp:Transcript_14627/g.38697  ORF Transcript_14627/g.38697 Transcript_14627/m.38697 type:complete len:468 (+) Transcript_14627:234-1637(+)